MCCASQSGSRDFSLSAEPLLQEHPCVSGRELPCLLRPADMCQHGTDWNGTRQRQEFANIVPGNDGNSLDLALHPKMVMVTQNQQFVSFPVFLTIGIDNQPTAC